MCPYDNRKIQSETPTLRGLTGSRGLTEDALSASAIPTDPQPARQRSRGRTSRNTSTSSPDAKLGWPGISGAVAPIRPPSCLRITRPAGTDPFSTSATVTVHPWVTADGHPRHLPAENDVGKGDQLRVRPPRRGIREHPRRHRRRRDLSYLGAHDEAFNTLALEDPELFKYPVAYIIEVGWWTLTDQGAGR